MKSQLGYLYFYLQELLKGNERFIRKIPPDSVSVLTFHHVVRDRYSFYPTIDPLAFEDLLYFLQRYFAFTTFRSLAHAERERPKVILRFDDGYYDFFQTVMPILHKHGIRANLNVCSGNLEGNIGWYEPLLSNLVRSAPASLLNELRIPDFPHQVLSDDLHHKASFFLLLNNFMLSTSAKQRAAFWACIEQATKNVRISSPAIRMMNASEVLQAATSHEIGMHSVNHQSMLYESDEYFERDLHACIDYFQETLKLPTDIYCFPYGHYRQQQVQILKRRGVKHILLVNAKERESGGGVYPSLGVHGTSRCELRYRALRRVPNPRNLLSWFK